LGNHIIPGATETPAGIELFVPGRLCLFGEHSDWAAGFFRTDPSVIPGICLIAGLDMGIKAFASPADNAFQLRQLDTTGHAGPLHSYPLDPSSLTTEASSGSYDSYSVGTAAEVLKRFPGLGLRLEVHHRDLPLGKGLSSSAAICVLTIRAFNLIYDLQLSIREEMELAYRGELATGSECGRMDQACAYGTTPLLLTFTGTGLEVDELDAAVDTHILLVDLKSSKNTRRILGDLNSAFAAGEPHIRRALGAENRRIVRAARTALITGNVQELGTLMTMAQDVFDRLIAPISPEELAAPVLHSVLEHPATEVYSWGGKGVGSQGDGAAQILCRNRETRRCLAEILERDLGVECHEFTIPARSIK